LSHALLEGRTEGTVALETALLSQLLSGERAPAANGLAIETDKTFDAQVVEKESFFNGYSKKNMF